jgi:hypothetical protein
MIAGQKRRDDLPVLKKTWICESAATPGGLWHSFGRKGSASEAWIRAEARIDLLEQRLLGVRPACLTVVTILILFTARYLRQFLRCFNGHYLMQS